MLSSWGVIVCSEDCWFLANTQNHSRFVHWFICSGLISDDSLWNDACCCEIFQHKQKWLKLHFFQKIFLLWLQTISTLNEIEKGKTIYCVCQLTLYLWQHSVSILMFVMYSQSDPLCLCGCTAYSHMKWPHFNQTISHCLSLLNWVHTSKKDKKKSKGR